jgi:phage shock protein PspC (stress-responsive transcriptional regulator)
MDYRPWIAEIGVMTETSTNGPRVSGAQVRDISRLRRPKEDRMVAGVAAGLSRHLDIDPIIPRVLFGALTIFGGAGILLYGIAWLTIPEDGKEKSAASDLLRRDNDVVMTVGLILAAIVAGMTMMGTLLWSAPNPWPVMVVAILAVLGIVVFSRRTDSPLPPPLPGSETGPNTTPPGPGMGPNPPGSGIRPNPPPSMEQLSDAPGGAAGTRADGVPAEERSDDVPAQESAGGTEQTATIPIPPSPTLPPLPPPRPRPPRSPLLPVTLCLVLLAEGVVWLVDEAADVDVHPSVYPGVAMAIIAAALLVGTWYGRSRWLIFFGVVASLTTMVATVLGPGPYGERIYTPQTAAQVSDRYEHGTGRLDLHLEQVSDIASLHGRTIDIESGIGQVTVYVPDSIDVTIDAKVTSAGDIEGIADIEDTGGGSVEARTTPVDDTDPDLTLNIRLRIGQIKIETVTCPDPAVDTRPRLPDNDIDAQGAIRVPAACN